MTIAFDAQSYPGISSVDQSWTHTPVGTPRGVIVMIVQDVGISDEVIGVTYGGVTMTEVPLSPFFHTATIEDATIYGYFLGSSIPTGGQTVAVDVNATGSVKTFAAITVTAAADTEVHDTSTLTTSSDNAPSVTMTVSSETIAMGSLHSGNAVVSAITPGSAFTQIGETDFGGTVSGSIRSTAAHSASNYDVDWTSSLATFQAILAVAIREVVSVIGSAGQVTETDLAQPVAWAPKARLVNLATETDFAQSIAATAPNLVPVVQALETDTAQPLTARRSRAVAQANEFDTAQAITGAKGTAIGQAVETDLAQPIDVADVGTPVGQVLETDTAFAIAVVPVVHQVSESDRAQQLTVLGGLVVISDAPVLIRAPRKAGRIFHEVIAPSGEGFHPTIGEWQSEEDAPGGFRAASGIIEQRTLRAHREIFQDGSLWKTYLEEDGTCIFAGRLKQPDPEGSVVQLSAEGRARIADREVGPILYQAHVGSELTHWFADTDQWHTSFPSMSHSGDGGGQNIMFERTPNATGVLGGANIHIPFFGREVAYMRVRMQGSGFAFISVQTRQRTRIPSLTNSHELNMTNTSTEHFYFNWESAQQTFNASIDLVVASGSQLPFPNTSVFTNEADPAVEGWGFVWPDIITISVDDWASTPDSAASTVLLMNFEVNGSPLGSRRSYSVGDLVEDIAARLGFRDVNVGGSYDITPYELPPGAPASEALDWACLLSGKRYRILDNGSRITFEFDRWDKNVWRLASPWSPMRTIPEQRYDAVSVPYSYPSTQGQLTDHVIARVDPSPLARKRVFHGIEAGEPSHNRDKAHDLGMEIAEILVRPRASGDFSAAEVIGEDGQKLSAHHVNAGDMIQGGLRIGGLTRFEDHVEGEFDGERKALTQLIARREKRLSRRNG